jgi:uncharacterized protein
LLDDGEILRLDPLVADWADSDRDKLVQEGHLTAEEAEGLQTGTVWAEGFFDAIHRFEALWQPPDEESGAALAEMLDVVAALMLAPTDPEYLAHVELHFGQTAPTRDDLLAEACWAVQDMRIFWVDHAPRPEQRRVEPAPGRNDPCPCGSGRKFKKCHGAAT